MAQDLNIEAKKVFRDIHLNERVLFNIEKELKDDQMDVILKEKSASAYLFRRNFATNLYLCGLEETEIRYVIGHDLDDVYETRNEYVNDKRRYEIFQKMNRRKFYAPNDLINAMDVAKEKMVNLDSMEKITFHQKAKLHLHIQANEPFDSIEVQVKKSTSKSKMLVLGTDIAIKRTMDISKILREKYFQNEIDEGE